MRYSILALILFMGACSRQNLYTNVGSSMSPTISDGEVVKVSPIAHNYDSIQRYDLVLFLDPTVPEKRYFLMRVWGLPGERIEIKNNTVTINGKLLEGPAEIEISLDKLSAYGKFSVIKLGESEFFVLGDNLGNSWDSRFWGALPSKNIIGVVND